MVEWTGEALRFIGVNMMYEPAVRFAEVKNYSCKIPSMLYLITQIARNNDYDRSILKPENINMPDKGILIDANGTPMESYEIAYYRPYFDLVGEFFGGGKFSNHFSKFTPVRLATHSFLIHLFVKNLIGKKSIVLVRMNIPYMIM